jgi:hypothetical protein
LMLQGYNDSRLKVIISQILPLLNWHCLRLQIITGPYAGWFVSYPLLDCRFHAGFDDGNPVYLISTKGAQRVWPVRRGCLLLLTSWSYFRICGGLHSILYLLQNYNYVWYIANFVSFGNFDTSHGTQCLCFNQHFLLIFMSGFSE